MRKPRAVTLFWATGYLLMVAALTTGLVHVRGRVMENLSGDSAQAVWRDWQAAARRQNQQPNPTVNRRLARTDEPPMLVLMRDHFAAVLIVSLVIVTVLFVFLMIILRGVFGGIRATAAAPNAVPGQGEETAEYRTS